MNATKRQELWKQLQSAGLVAGEMPAGSASPWYIRVMLGIAGWIGALFFLGFIGAGFAMVMRSSGAASIVAFFCCCGAYAIFRMAAKSDFASQFGLATGLVGQILFAVAIFKEFNFNSYLGYFLFFCIEAALTVIMPNFIHRIFTTLAAIGAFSIWFAQAGFYGLALPIIAAACALVWRGELRLAARAELWQPVGYGLALGLLQAVTISVLAGDQLFRLHRAGNGWMLKHGAEIGTLLVAVIFLAVIVEIMGKLEISCSSSEGIAILCCSVAAMAVSFPTHGLAAAWLILILGFGGGNRILFGLGLFSLASFLSHYYYQMHETLLFKSMILAGMGILLIAARWAMHKLFPTREARQNA